MTNKLALRQAALDYAIETSAIHHPSPADLVAAARVFERYLESGQVGMMSERLQAFVAGNAEVAPPVGRVTAPFTDDDKARAVDALRASIAAGKPLSWRALSKQIGVARSTLALYRDEIETLAGLPATKSGAADGPPGAVDVAPSRAPSEGAGAANATPIAVAPDTPLPPASKPRAPKKPSGLPSRSGVVSDSDRAVIRQAYRDGAKVPTMAAKYGVCRRSIYNICKGVVRVDPTDAVLGRHKLPEPVDEPPPPPPPPPPAVSRETPRQPIRAAVPGLTRTWVNTTAEPPGAEDARQLRRAGHHCIWRPAASKWAVDDREVTFPELAAMVAALPQAGRAA